MEVKWYYEQDGEFLEGKPSFTGQKFKKEIIYTNGTKSVVVSYYTAPEDLPVE